MYRTFISEILDSNIKPTFESFRKEFNSEIENIKNLPIAPSTHIEEKVIKIDLAGVKKEDIKITLDGKYLVVEASRENIYGENEKLLRKIILNTALVDLDNITSKYVDGILTINLADLPKKETSKNIKID